MKSKFLLVAGLLVFVRPWLADVAGMQRIGHTTLTPLITSGSMLPGGAFQFAFTGVPNATNTVLTATSVASSLATWAEVGVVPEFSPGLYLFSEPQAANDPHRFYRIRSP